MKKSFKTLRALSSATLALCLLMSAALFSGCKQAPDTISIDLSFPATEYGTGTTYTVNGKTVSDEYWKEFVRINFTAINNKKFGLTTTDEWGSNTENLWFTIETDGSLKYNYESGYGSYSGTILGVNDTIKSKDNGFVLLLKTNHNHTNYDKGSCSGAPSEFDDTAAHSCYLPVYFAVNDSIMINGAYYSSPTACFYNESDALNNMKYDSLIYGSAASYPAR